MLPSAVFRLVLKVGRLVKPCSRTRRERRALVEVVRFAGGVERLILVAHLTTRVLESSTDPFKPSIAA